MAHIDFTNPSTGHLLATVFRELVDALREAYQQVQAPERLFTDHAQATLTALDELFAARNTDALLARARDVQALFDTLPVVAVDDKVSDLELDKTLLRTIPLMIEHMELAIKTGRRTAMLMIEVPAKEDWLAELKQAYEEGKPHAGVGQDC